MSRFRREKSKKSDLCCFGLAGPHQHGSVLQCISAMEDRGDLRKEVAFTVVSK